MSSTNQPLPSTKKGAATHDVVNCPRHAAVAVVCVAAALARVSSQSGVRHRHSTGARRGTGTTAAVAVEICRRRFACSLNCTVTPHSCLAPPHSQTAVPTSDNTTSSRSAASSTDTAADAQVQVATLANTLAGISHANVSKPRGTYVVDGVPWLVVEASLLSLTDVTAPLWPLWHAVAVCRDVAAALSYLHSQSLSAGGVVAAQVQLYPLSTTSTAAATTATSTTSSITATSAAGVAATRPVGPWRAKLVLWPGDDDDDSAHREAARDVDHPEPRSPPNQQTRDVIDLGALLKQVCAASASGSVSGCGPGLVSCLAAVVAGCTAAPSPTLTAPLAAAALDEALGTIVITALLDRVLTALTDPSSVSTCSPDVAGMAAVLTHGADARVGAGLIACVTAQCHDGVDATAGIVTAVANAMAARRGVASVAAIGLHCLRTAALLAVDAECNSGSTSTSTSTSTSPRAGSSDGASAIKAVLSVLPVVAAAVAAHADDLAVVDSGVAVLGVVSKLYQNRPAVMAVVDDVTAAAARCLDRASGRGGGGGGDDDDAAGLRRHLLALLSRLADRGSHVAALTPMIDKVGEYLEEAADDAIAVECGLGFFWGMSVDYDAPANGVAVAEGMCSLAWTSGWDSG